MTTTNIKLNIPNEVRETSRVLRAAGFENFLVGGCVRDLVLGRAPKDWDLTTIATPEEIIALFPHTFYENEFGTVGVVNDEVTDERLKNVESNLDVIEVTPYRLESGYSDGRHP